VKTRFAARMNHQPINGRLAFACALQRDGYALADEMRHPGGGSV
jgi:hypothetical protein